MGDAEPRVGIHHRRGEARTTIAGSFGIIQGCTSCSLLHSRCCIMRSHFLAVLVASAFSLLACSSDVPVAPSPPPSPPETTSPGPTSPGPTSPEPTPSPGIALDPTSKWLCSPPRPGSTRNCPGSVYVTITNTDTGALVWRAQSNKSWLKISSTSGSAPSTVIVSVDGTGMLRRRYWGAITFTAVDHPNETAVLSVTMEAR